MGLDSCSPCLDQDLPYASGLLQWHVAELHPCPHEQPSAPQLGTAS